MKKKKSASTVAEEPVEETAVAAIPPETQDESTEADRTSKKSRMKI